MKAAAAAAVPIVALVFALMGRGLDEPFDMGSHQGWNGAYYSIVGRNYLRYGPGPLALAMCMEGGAVVERPAVYLNHPPMIGLLVAASFALLGEGEAQARSVALALSLAAALLLYVCLLRACGGRWWPALAGTVLSISAPVWALYGAMPDPQGAGVVVAVAGAMGAMARWSKTARARDLVAAHAFLLFGFLMDWPAFFAAPALAGWALAVGGRRARAVAAGLLAHALIAGGGLLLWAHLVAQRLPSADLLGVLATHVMLEGVSADDPRAVGFGRHLAQLASHHAAGFFLPVSIAGALAAVAIAARWRRAPAEGLLLVPLLAGAVHVALFRSGAWAHDYWQFYLAPGLALPLAARLGAGRWRTLGLAALVAGSVACGFARVSARTVEARDLARQAGVAIRAAIAPHETLASTARRSVPIEYYSDRKILWNVRGAAELARQWDAARPPVGAFLVDASNRAPFAVLTDAWGPGKALGPLTLWDLR